MSNTAPVVKEFSAEASQATIAAQMRKVAARIGSGRGIYWVNGYAPARPGYTASYNKALAQVKGEFDNIRVVDWADAVRTNPKLADGDNIPRDRKGNVVSPGNFLPWREMNGVFEDIASLVNGFKRYFTEPAVRPPTRCFSITANDIWSASRNTGTTSPSAAPTATPMS